MAIGEPGITHVSKLVGARSILFADTERSKLQKKISVPIADQVYTPEAFQNDLGSHQISYPGYHELAYLHPNRFTPNPAVLDKAGLEENERFVILRSVSWDAVHDVGDSGFENIVDIVSVLEETGVKVIITSEGDLPDTIKNYQLSIDPHQIHHLMFYADLFIGESATMATESAILGTPAIFVSSSTRGYTEELEEKYGLVFNYNCEDRNRLGMNKAIEILNDNDSGKWDSRRQNMLDEKSDMTEYVVSELEK